MATFYCIINAICTVLVMLWMGCIVLQFIERAYKVSMRVYNSTVYLEEQRNRMIAHSVISNILYAALAVAFGFSLIIFIEMITRSIFL